MRSDLIFLVATSISAVMALTVPNEDRIRMNQYDPKKVTLAVPIKKKTGPSKVPVVVKTTSSVLVKPTAHPTTTTTVKHVTPTTTSSKAPTSTAKPNQPFAQCGGQDFDGTCLCTDGYHCEWSGLDYAQCLPNRSSTPSFWNLIGNPFGGNLADPFDQCGGIGWLGATICPDGYKCNDSTEHFSQCLPNFIVPRTF